MSECTFSELLENKDEYAVAIKNLLDSVSNLYTDEYIPQKQAESLTTHQPPKLHPEVQRLLQFETIYNLYYPEAVSQLEATTVEEFNKI